MKPMKGSKKTERKRKEVKLGAKINNNIEALMLQRAITAKDPLYLLNRVNKTGKDIKKDKCQKKKKDARKQK